MSAHLSLNRFLRVGVILFAFGLVFIGFTGEAAHAGPYEGYLLAQEDDDDDGDDGGQAPVGGVDTGAGGTAPSNGSTLPFILGGGSAALFVAAGTALRRRFST